MAKFTRRRRRREQWLPNFGTSSTNVEGGAQAVSGRGFDFLIPADGTTLTAIVPVTFDEPHDEGESPTAVSMADAIGSGFSLRRIVGKVYAAVEQIPQPVNTVSGALLGIGWLVARADDSNENIPVGHFAAGDQYDVLSPLNAREPWIWRRTWVLSNRAQNSQFAGSQYPRSTTEYGSVMDGGHVDAKTMRNITQDDRLWLAISMTKYPPDPGVVFDSGLPIEGYVDVRYLGHLVKNRQHGSF